MPLSLKAVLLKFTPKPSFGQPPIGFTRFAARFFLVLVLVLGVPLTLIFLIDPAPAVNLIWDLANIAGYMAIVLCLLLFFYSGRPRAFPPFSSLFFINLHRDLGYCALFLAAIHIALALFKEPLLLEHLKPTAPLYMLAGLAGAILIMLLVILSLPRARKTLWQNHRTFRAVHSCAAVLAVFLVGFHVVHSHFYLNSIWKTILVLSAAVAMLVYYLVSKLLVNKPLINKLSPATSNSSATRIRTNSGLSRTIIYLSIALVLAVALITLLITNLTKNV